MLGPSTRWFILKILPYPIISFLGSVIYSIVELGLLGSSSVYPATGNAYNPVTSFFFSGLLTFILGLSLGIIEEKLFKNYFQHLSFILKLLIKTALYLLVLVSLMVVFAFIMNSINMNRPINDPMVMETVKGFFQSFTFISLLIYAGFLIDTTLFFSEIVDYLGIDVVGNYFNGKYSKPAKERRIFMFLDMKGSTTIAEKLGHEKHYQLINEYYRDMSSPIIETEGQIYQYVGDEIIISWKLDNGVDPVNCLKCFDLIQQRIDRKSQIYVDKYDVVPSFKAGMHVGEVTRGQIGKIKREMLFIGDVLNTTARIQGLCNELNANVLISGILKDMLPTASFDFKDKGAFELKGKQEVVILYEVQIPRAC